MDITDALTIVLELAKQNVIDARDEPEMAEEQQEACKMVEDLIVNQLGDD